MTSKTSKFRSLFLAALMVFSVFAGTVAFTGTAAAAGNISNVTVSDTPVKGGSTVTHTTVDFELEDLNDPNSNEDVYVELYLTQGAEITGLSSNSVNISSSNFNVQNGNLTFTLQPSSQNKHAFVELGDLDISYPSVSSNQTVELRANINDTGGTNVDKQISSYQITENNAPTLRKATHYVDSENGSILELAFTESIATNGSVTINFEDGSSTTVAGNSNLSIEGPGGDARVVVNTTKNVYMDVKNVTVSGFADSAGNSKQQTASIRVAPATADVADNSSKLEYQGVNIAVEGGSTDETFRIIRPDGSGINRGTGVGSQVYVFGTDGAPLGTYTFNDTDSADSATVDLQSLGLSVSADDTSVTTDDNITATVTADDINRPITAELMDSDGTVVDTVDTMIDSDGQVNVNFGAEAAGDYTIKVTDDRTAVTATSSTITVTEAADKNAQITNIERDQRGDVANITLSLTNSDVATLKLGTVDAGFVSNVTVEDTNNDGTVTLQWNTYLADNSTDNNPVAISQYDDTAANQWSAAGSDTVTGTNVQTSIRPGPGHVISSGTYTLEVAPSEANNMKFPGPATDVGAITLEARASSPSVQLWTAPKAVSISSLSDISSAASAGDLTKTETIAKSDTLVVQIDAEGLEGAFSNQSTLNADATAAWFDMTSNDTVNLTMTEQILQASNDSPNSFLVAATGADAATGTTGVDVIANANGDTYYVVVNTSTVSGELGQMKSGETYDTKFTIPAHYRNQANFGLVSPNSNGEFVNETAMTQFEVVAGSFAINTAASGNVEVRAAANQTISGTSTYAPGTELRVRVQSKSGSSSQFIIGPRTVTVGPKGTWSLTSDFGSYNVGSTFTVTASTHGTTKTADGVIKGAPRVISLTFNDQTSSGEVVRVQEVELNAGGFVAIHEGSASGDIVGVSSYISENTPTSNLRIIVDKLNTSKTLVAMPHRDMDGNGQFNASVDSPYTENGQPVTDSARITLEGAVADFQVSNLSPQDVTVTAGETVNVSATITNEGTASATQTVEFRVGGNVVATQNVTLDAGASTTVNFSADTTGLSGELTHGVFTDDGDQTATLTVESETTPTPTPEPSTPTPTPEPGTPTPGAGTTTDGESGPGFGVIVSVLALLGAALLAARRNN